MEESMPRSFQIGNADTVLSVVIPALNEQDSIAEIVSRVKEVADALNSIGIGGLEIIVIDDGSQDSTAEIVSGLDNVKLLRHRETRGYGAAIKTGFAQAQGELVAFMDADGTYPPEHLPALCRAILEDEAEMAVGSRRSGALSHMPRMRRFGNFLWSNLVSMIGKDRCIDPASGMRVLRRSFLDRLYPLPDGLNFTPVMSTRAMHEGLKVIELPIPYHERQGRSKLNVIHDGTRFLKTIIWTSLEYNPVRVLGFIGMTFFAVAGLIGLCLILARSLGIRSVGPWGIFALFGALVLSVSGVSLYTLGVTFNILVALFHRRRLKQGMFANPRVERALQSRFGWMGISFLALGSSLAVFTMVLGAVGWDIARLWLWLLGSAMFVLTGLQLLISWIVVRVLEFLAGRDVLVEEELNHRAAMADTGITTGLAKV
jgi:glycosyltransferase involved in cell wall biosynthesis